MVTHSLPGSTLFGDYKFCANNGFEGIIIFAFWNVIFELFRRVDQCLKVLWFRYDQETAILNGCEIDQEAAWFTNVLLYFLKAIIWMALQWGFELLSCIDQIALE